MRAIPPKRGEGLNMGKYFTIVIRADDEKAARSLVPGESIRGNTITACSMGDAIALSDKFKELIADENAVGALEYENLKAFLP
jgi:hypothetical protein